jgi:hypothetical protein
MVKLLKVMKKDTSVGEVMDWMTNSIPGRNKDFSL